ncbi:MAG: glutaminase A [Rhodoferax sp.]|nr:glutaminase A [Rhodoferax sp.]
MIQSPIQRYLEDLHARIAPLSDGAVADYIPELQLANPGWFGICIATHDGHVYEVGDTRQAFTIQSISKPLTYGLALEQNGKAAVLAKIGVEPSGDAFNAISLQPETGRPMNPLINAGAIATCGLITGDTTADKMDHILGSFSRFAGRTLEIDAKVYQSESATGHRNRAIGWMLHNFNILADEPTPTLEAYFQQCAIEVTCHDLAMVGATLANGGVNPVTGTRALAQEFVSQVLSVMATCGMYDASGDWLYQTGLPAKSGVGGGILAVQPGRLAIAVFSPRLDAQGNSTRGVAVCRAIADDLQLHVMDGTDRNMTPVRRSLTRRSAASKQRRSESASGYLKRAGDRIRLYHLHGALVFSTVEEIIRRLMARAPESEVFVLNLKLVQGVNPAAARLLSDTQKALQTLGKELLFSDASVCWHKLVDAGVDPQSFYADDDFALEHAENRLLSKLQPTHPGDTPFALAECALFRGLDAQDMLLLERFLLSRTYYKNQSIVSAGQASNELFVITQGKAMVSTPTEHGIARLDVFPPGSTFGEVAFVDQSPRSANVTALNTVECKILTRDAFSDLENEAPKVKIRLMENIALSLAGTVRQINRELASLK